MPYRLLPAALLLALAASAAHAQPRLLANTTPGDAGTSPTDITAVDGKVYFRSDDTERPLAVFRYDPAADRVTTMRIEQGEWASDLWAFGSRLYLSAGVGERTHLLSVDPATSRATRVTIPAEGEEGASPDFFSGAGERALFSASQRHPGQEEDSQALMALSATGRVTALEPAAVVTGSRELSAPVVVGDAVYYAVSTENADGDAVERLWRASGGTAAPFDVLPSSAAGRLLHLATAGETLLVFAEDSDKGDVQLFRLAAGAARASAVPHFSASNLLWGSLVTSGDAYVFAQSEPQGESERWRVRMWYGTGEAAPARVDGLDLGMPDVYVAGLIQRGEDGMFYTWGYEAQSASDSPTGFYRIDPASGRAQRVGRVGEGVSVSPNAGFAVVDGRVYFAGYREDVGSELFMLPLDR